jgi:SAM-dependent methyltransferase
MSPWTETDPTNRVMVEQRDERARELVARLVHPPRRVLDLGCGRGEVLPTLGLDGVGVDVSPVRLLLAPIPVARADGARLPFRDGAFDAVVAFNVLSSIPGEAHRRAVAGEISRVLAPDGIVLWYDQRWPNPGNRGTRPVGRRDLTTLFPGAELDLEPITVAPPLARTFPRSYRRLHALTPLRSHLVGVIRPVGP